MDSKHYLDFAKKIAKKAGKILLEYYQTNIQINFKGGDKRNLVTEVDILSERLIVDAIKKEFPDHCFLAEEGGDCGIKPSDYKWVIDPVDGTTNYAHGYPFFCASVAATCDGEVVAGAVYEPLKEELYTAERGGGAHLNGRRLKVSGSSELLQSLLVTGFPYDLRDDLVNKLRLFNRFMGEARAIRRDGAAALDLAHLAAGRIDGFWEERLQPWDMLAAKLMIEEAGGRLTRFDGSPTGLRADEVLASNGPLHAAMMAVLAGSSS